MTVHCGFFNSVNHDRLYSNKDFINLFNGIYTVGIFQNYGNQFSPIVESSDKLYIDSGMAWLGDYWFVNDEKVEIKINNPFDNNSHIVGIEIDDSQRLGYFTSYTLYEYKDIGTTKHFYPLFSWHKHGGEDAYNPIGFDYNLSMLGLHRLDPVKSALDPKNKIEVDIIPTSSIKSILD